ncbi:hypothetical protein Nepgr_014765 [Nepenthes gracilis]|uniref:Uncharacterized protein n=1 Tax=Nepenthes gracilis TaxID=150966 RepID=A0AAD3SLD6_NEPGR|nr:hypothetical protein Nepgr_014765 [Nepenthes gracilis]
MVSAHCCAFYFIAFGLFRIPSSGNTAGYGSCCGSPFDVIVAGLFTACSVFFFCFAPGVTQAAPLAAVVAHVPVLAAHCADDGPRALFLLLNMFGAPGSLLWFVVSIMPTINEAVGLPFLFCVVYLGAKLGDGLIGCVCLTGLSTTPGIVGGRALHDSVLAGIKLPSLESLGFCVEASAPKAWSPKLVVLSCSIYSILCCGHDLAETSKLV